MDRDRYYKDPMLEGIYVKRCKCGARPYYDRCPGGGITYWIGCECGRTGESDIDFNVAIDNWNNDKLTY